MHRPFLLGALFLGAAAGALAQEAVPRPTPVLQPPLVVPPPVIEVPRPPPAPLPPPPAAIQRPPTLTTCDAGGCWDSNGSRLSRSGPVLLGPGGACTVSGGVVQCP